MTAEAPYVNPQVRYTVLQVTGHGGCGPWASMHEEQEGGGDMPFTELQQAANQAMHYRPRPESALVHASSSAAVSVYT